MTGSQIVQNSVRPQTPHRLVATIYHFPLAPNLVRARVVAFLVQELVGTGHSKLSMVRMIAGPSDLVDGSKRRGPLRLQGCSLFTTLHARPILDAWG